MTRHQGNYTTGGEINTKTKISPSKLGQALACNGSPLNEQEAKRKGAHMHLAAEQLMKTGKISVNLTQKEYRQVTNYLKYLKEQVGYFDGRLYLEHFLKSNYDGLSDGRCDALILGGNRFYGSAKIVDFKTGEGENSILKEQENAQLKIYALFVFDEFPDLNTIVVSIYHASTGKAKNVPYSRQDIEKWRNECVLPMCDRIKNNDTSCTPGEHCMHCSGRLMCKARKDLMLYVMQKANHPETMTLDEAIYISSQATAIRQFLKETEQIAQPAADAGYTIPGIIIEETTRRELTERGKQQLKDKGVDPYKYEKRQKSITDLESEAGKGFVKYMTDTGGYKTTRRKKHKKDNKKLAKIDAD